MRVTIAGGTGFLGRHVTEALRAAGHSVLLLARGTRPAVAADGVAVVPADVAAGDVPLEKLRGGDAGVADALGRGAGGYACGSAHAGGYLPESG